MVNLFISVVGGVSDAKVRPYILSGSESPPTYCIYRKFTLTINLKKGTQMGSVKDITVQEKPQTNALGRGVFTFSDRYSVFDWGGMPDLIPNKGAALCLMAAWNFERLENEGVRTHYQGLVDQNGEIVQIDKLCAPSNQMVVDLTNVYPPVVKSEKGQLAYDYSLYEKGRLDNFLVPLEVIFRNGFPLGSSVFDKLAKGLITIKDLGLEQEPKPGDMLEEPIIEFTTKLEESDRALSREEAQKISGLSISDFDKLFNLARKVNAFITDRAKQVGLIHYDGKIEVFFHNGLVLCDVVGTFDEDRFMLKGQQVSKEILRQWYKKNQPEWKAAVDTAKSEAASQGTKNWPALCSVQPKPLDTDILELVSHIYMAGANLYTGIDFFDVPPLSNLVDKLVN